MARQNVYQSRTIEHETGESEEFRIENRAGCRNVVVLGQLVTIWKI